MNETFYAGHEFKWINNFLKAIPKNKRFQKSIAVGIACCIHHQFIYKKQPTFKLTHKILTSFGIDRRCLRRYLSIFQQASLIKYTIKCSKSPIITLLLLPYNYYIINKDTIIQYTVPLCNDVQDPVHPCTGRDASMYRQPVHPRTGLIKGSKAKEPTQQVKEPIPQVKEPTQQVKEPIPQVKEPIPQVKEPTQQVKELTKQGVFKKDLVVPDKWYPSYTKEFYNQIDVELEKTQNKGKKKVEIR